MKRIIGMVAGACALVAAMTAGAGATPLKVAYSVWVGYGPLFVAAEKGYFKDEGLDVELVLVEDTKLRFAALAAGQIDVMATSVDALPLYLKPGQDYRYLFGIDESVGADGVLARNEIRTVADFKGRTVAFSKGSVTEFLLTTLLDEAGLSIADITPQNMQAGDAGSAFITGQVDVAVTWEPYLSKGDATEHGYKFTDSSKYPGLIVDAMVTTLQETEARKAELAALYRAWTRAVAFTAANPEEANAIMGKGLGGWLAKPAVIADVLTGVRLMGAERNAEYMGTPAAPGAITAVIAKALSVWQRQGALQVNAKPEELISFSALGQ